MPVAPSELFVVVRRTPEDVPDPPLVLPDRVIVAAAIGSILLLTVCIRYPVPTVLIPAAILTVAAAYVLSRPSRRRMDEVRRERRRRASADAHEAWSLGERLREGLRRMDDLVNQIRLRHGQLASTVARARRELESGRPLAFWASVASANRDMLFCVNTFNSLGWELGFYLNGLKHRDHTFPVPPLDPDDLPPRMPETFSELARLVQQAEGDSQTAAAFERVKEREDLDVQAGSLSRFLHDYAVMFEVEFLIFRRWLHVMVHAAVYERHPRGFIAFP